MSGDQQLYKQLMSQGHSAAWDNEWQKAADFYRQALAEFPESAQAQANLAAAYHELGEYGAALDQYRRVIERSPNDVLVLEKIAQLFEMLGQHKAGAETALRVAEVHLKNDDVGKALENWTRTIRLDPANLRARSRLALHHEKNNQYNQAVQEYLAIASLLQHQGSKDRAVEIIMHALKLQPGSDEATQALGLLRANQLLPLPDAKPLRRDALLTGQTRRPERLEAPREPVVDPDDPIMAAEKAALTALAGLMFEQSDNLGERRGGRELSYITMGTGPLNRVQQETTQINLHVGQAVDLQARGHFGQAIIELERAVALGLDHSAAFFDLGVLNYRDGALEPALRHLQTAVKHPDYALPSRLMMGRILRQTGRLHDGAVQYLEALRIVDSRVVPSDQADSLMQVYEPLIEAYSNEESPETDGLLAARIDELLVQQHWLDKVRQMRRQLQDQPEGMPPLPIVELITQFEAVQVVDMLPGIYDLARRGYHRIAMEEAFNALQYAPTYLPLHTFMGELLMQQDRVPEAITKFSTVARAYSARGEAGRSIDLFRRITRLAPLDLPARQRLIEHLTASGKTEETIQEYLELGDVYYRLAELDRARETYQRALNLSQQAHVGSEWTIEILHHLADIDMQRLDFVRAVKIYEQIARIDPGDKKAAIDLIDQHFRLGNITAALAALGNHVAFLNREGRQHEALDSLETLLQNNPEQLAIKRTLAEQFETAGNTARAVEIWDEIGNQLLNDGDTAGARQAIEMILSLDPLNAGEYRRLLENLQAD